MTFEKMPVSVTGRKRFLTDTHEFVSENGCYFRRRILTKSSFLDNQHGYPDYKNYRKVKLFIYDVLSKYLEHSVYLPLNIESMSWCLHRSNFVRI